MHEEQQQNEGQNEWRITTKGRKTTTNITKVSLEVLSSKVTSLGAFVLQLKK